MSRFRLLFSVFALVALATMLVACGGDDDDGGSANEDPQKVLDQTFSGDNESVESGNLSLSFNVEATGDEGGTIDAELSGPFENQGEAEVPKFDLSATADVSGDGDDFNFEGGLISTGDAAFVNYNDSDYEVDQSLFDRFKDQVESSAGQQGEGQQSTQELLDALGLEDPSSLLVNLTNEGTADVEGTETTHISGDLDVERSIDALKNLIGRANTLTPFGGGANVPSPEELDQVSAAVKEAHFDVYSGSDDNILRRMTISVLIEPPSDQGKVDLAIDFTLSGVNESQSIEAPSGAKPFNDLLSELGVDPAALGALGALGGGTGSGDTGGGSPDFEIRRSEPGSAEAEAEAAQEYLNCVSKAQSAADLQACSSLAP